MNKTISILKFKKIFTVFIILSYLHTFIFTSFVSAQQLDSTTYRIIDPTLDSSGGTSESTTYGLTASLGGSLSDRRLESGSYALKSGFPNGIQANVPTVRCFETTTTSGTTDCTDFPNANGAQGECGTPGCYDRAKFEFNPENNPFDTLYLVMIYNNTTSTTYYLQSDHTLSTTYDIGDYMTTCEIMGIDARTGSDCEILTDPNWDEDLQRANVLNTSFNTQYTASVRALHGDYTESEFSEGVSATTSLPTLTIDLDIGTTSGSETSAPHSIPLGLLTAGIVKTSTDSIWIDYGTNIIPGMTSYVKDTNNGLYNGTDTIPSQTEDLDVDSGLDGGYGIKITSSSETSLGPIIEDTVYETAGSNEVGALSTSNATIFSTNTTGANKGPVTAGRASVIVKALAVSGISSGNYTDTITFTMVSNF